MIYQPITILTAELKELDYYSNVERTNELRMELLNQGYSIVGVKMNDMQAFLVTGANYKKLQKLAGKFGQSLIFISDKNRETTEISCLETKTKRKLGKLIKISKCGTMNSDSTVRLNFIEDGKEHFFQTEN